MFMSILLNLSHPLEAIILELDFYLLLVAMLFVFDDLDGDDELMLNSTFLPASGTLSLEIAFSKIIVSIFGYKAVYYKN